MRGGCSAGMFAYARTYARTGRRSDGWIDRQTDIFIQSLPRIPPGLGHEENVVWYEPSFDETLVESVETFVERLGTFVERLGTFIERLETLVGSYAKREEQNKHTHTHIHI